jgi:hypothetical protein
MARYGQFKYGTGVKYGATPATGLLRWAVEIDWDRDGIFSGENEARRMFSVFASRGRKTMLRATGSGFQTIQPGICTIKLRNNDRRFDGWNQNSPLYPHVTYGPEVRIRVTNQEDGIRRNFFAGTITDIRPFGYGGDAYVEIKIEDYSRFLRSYRARTPISQGLTPGAAINAILNDVNWPTRWGRAIDNGSGTIRYHWASGNKLAWSELEDVAQSFLGLFFIDAAGRAVFVDRNTEPELSIGLTQAELLKDISNPQPFVFRRNVTRLKVHPRRETDTPEVIYQVIGDPILVEPGTPRTIWANYSYNNQPVPAKDVLQPVATTDYLANNNSDGTGSDRTSDCSVALTDFGDNAKMVFTNTSGTNFYVTQRQIRGTAVYEENVDDVTFPEDPSSVKEPREFILDLPWQQSVNVANDYALVLGDFLNTLHPFPAVKVQGRPDVQFSAELFDAVPLDIERLGIVGQSLRVGGLEHRSIDVTCQDVETKFYLEPYIGSGDYWTWPIEDFGVDTIFGAG